MSDNMELSVIRELERYITDLDTLQIKMIRRLAEAEYNLIKANERVYELEEHTSKVQIQERGWAGHYILANRCRFRRNTLLTYGNTRIVVSTVGLMESRDEKSFETIGYNRHYETMAFYALDNDSRYHDADVSKEVSFNSRRSISELDADDKANDMHEAVVAELSAKIGGLND